MVSSLGQQLKYEIIKQKLQCLKDVATKLKVSLVIIHQIFFARAIDLNTSRDAAKAGEYSTIRTDDIPQFSNFVTYVRMFSFHLE